MRSQILVGTSSWTDKSLSEFGEFYPADVKTPEARLRFYASQFPIVEIDSSYYAIPAERTAEQWAERTPDDFVFKVEAFRLLTTHQTQRKKELHPFVLILIGCFVRALAVVFLIIDARGKALIGLEFLDFARTSRDSRNIPESLRSRARCASGATVSRSIACSRCAAALRGWRRSLRTCGASYMLVLTSGSRACLARVDGCGTGRCCAYCLRELPSVALAIPRSLSERVFHWNTCA
jgi:hypothetical protein